MVEIKDLGIGRLKAEIARMSELRVHAGVQGQGARQPHPNADGASVAEVAAWQEFGTPTAPARPFLRTGLDKHAGRIQEALRSTVSDLIDGRADTAAEAMDKVASETGKRLLEHFDDARSWAEPLSPRTAAAKGHDQPLIDTGTVRENLLSVVVEIDSLQQEAAE